MGWGQVPEPMVEEARPPVVAAWALAVVPLLLYLRTHEVSGGRTGWLLAWAVPLGLLAAALLVMGRRVPVMVALLAPVAVLVSWLVLPDGGAQVGLVLVLGAGVWGVGVGVVPLAAARLDGGRRLRPVLLLAAVADLLLVFGVNLRFPAALLLATVLIGAVVAFVPGPSDRLLGAFPRSSAGGELRHRFSFLVSRFGAVVGRTLAAIAMVPAAIVVTVLWCIERLVRHDQLRSPSGDETGWVVRLGSDQHPERYHATVSVLDRRPLRARVASVTASVVVVAMISGGILALRTGRTVEPAVPEPANGQGAVAEQPVPAPSECSPAADDPVLGTQPEYEVMACERSEAFARGLYRAPSGYRLADFAGETINVSDGVRRTWRPPVCDCTRVRVWWFGGSAAWGEGQRDEYTLPSMFARLAWEQGIALDIENRAMPTWTLGQEVHLLADLLSQTAAPDLVVFYTGGNDIVFQGLRLLDGRGDDSSDVVLHERLYSDLLRNGIPVRPEEVEWSPDPDSFEGTLGTDAARALAPAVTNRLERNFELAQMLAEATDTPVRVALQPLLAASAPGAGPDGLLDPSLLESFTALVEATRATLPDGMTDLSAVYSEVQEPVFYDLFHTGERGAEIMAASILEWLRPLLEELSGGG